ncbi:hypothetical protein NBRC116494_03170 [Aurantivibrio plasticivorans]
MERQPNLITSISLFIVLITATAFSNASDGFFYVTPQFTITHLSFDRELVPEGLDRTSNAIGAQVSAGYQTPFWVVAEVGYGYAENIEALGSTFDNHEIGEYRYALGVAIPLGNNVRLVPKAGRIRYRVTAEEGQFLNAGSEQGTTIENNEHYLQLDLEIRLSDLVGLDLSYVTANTHFGDIDAARIGVQFEF